MSVRLSLCLLASVWLAACEADDRSQAAPAEATDIDVQHGLLSLEAQSKLPTYVRVSPDQTVTVWRADGDRAVTVGSAEVARGLADVRTARDDPVWIFAEHDPAAGEMIEMVRSLRDQGFIWVVLVEPGGWVPPEPSEAASPS